MTNKSARARRASSLQVLWSLKNLQVLIYYKLPEKNHVITYASVNSICAQLPPPAPLADLRALAFFFLPWMANSRRWGLLSCQIRRGGDKKRVQMPRPPSTLQHFSLIAQSNSSILSILMSDFLFQLTSSFVVVLF